MSNDKININIETAINQIECGQSIRAMIEDVNIMIEKLGGTRKFEVGEDSLLIVTYILLLMNRGNL